MSTRLGAVPIRPRRVETWDEARAEEYPQRLALVAALVNETLPRADLWMAEFGYADWRRPDGRPSEWSYAVYEHEHTAAFQADALVRAHALALGTAILSLTTWYRIDDLLPAEEVIGDENNRHLGILDVAGRPKPGFHALRLWNRLFDAPVRPADAAVQAVRGSPALARTFEKRSGELIVVAWLRSALRAEARDATGMERDVREETVGIRLPHDGTDLEVYDPRTGERMASEAILDGPLLARVRLRGPETFVARITPPARRRSSSAP